MARATEEWVGKHDDSKIPDRVKDRIMERENRTCYLSGRKFMPGDPIDWDHRIALINWAGEGHGNRESNIYPVLRAPHKEKTKQDVKIKAKSARTRQKHLGIKKPQSSLSHARYKRKMDGTVVDRQTGEPV
ncbi:hypothetical protein [Pelagibacterium luteolum]|uniref:HNH endonuclease n=1 Tax=Pelagibacterium luteolum TaxID=440168 RepID=A0A1G7TKH0_9HYPH|nr:hypothetical protein [Pelagibacterium luteolum]SDG35602.1 hypothetical protein SAMN04487974_102176 [Pelagibacterium luteolum]